ncbi:Odorant receptor 83c [Culex quinquefasciatus]|uniref:Odorant receptor n=1 Tax=Culex quinquefasciatus TaxID=7176 RepID=B0X8X2_CULQU|nr:Odorant receptor 83c [Culex quinquefasciatus]|eukprot:XP_001866094.1 Odorant receptor 83c [Culex quinquefasciatus]
MDIRAKLRRQFRLLDEEALRRERAIDAYNEIIVYLRRFLYPVGMDVLDANFHWNWRTSLSLGCLVTYFSFLVYTVYVYWGELMLTMEAFSITGIGVQGIFKMRSGFKYFDFFNQRYRLLKALHARNSCHQENNRALVFCCLLIGVIFKVFFIAYLISGTGFLLIPMYMYVMHNEKLMVLKVNVPGFDPTTQLGFLVTTGYHTLLIFMAIAGILASDLGIMLIVLHIVGIADVFKNGLKELDELLTDEDRTDEEVHEKVLEICIMHRELIVYEEELDSCYATIVFVQVITSVACLVLSLFIFYVTQNIGSGLFIIAAFFQLLEFCMLGTALTIKNEEILLALYDVRWNALSNQQRKLWQFLLHRSQNAVEMTIGGVALLNMETFVEISSPFSTNLNLRLHL